MKLRLLSLVSALTLAITLALAGCTAPPSDPLTPPSPTGPQQLGPTLDPSAPNIPLPRRLGLTPEIKPETRVLTAQEAANLTGVRIENRARCTSPSEGRPKCRYSLAMTSVPDDIQPGTVLVGSVSPKAAAGFLIKVTSVGDGVINGEEGTLSDAIAQGETDIVRGYTVQQVTKIQLRPGVTLRDLPRIAKPGGVSRLPSLPPSSAPTGIPRKGFLGQVPLGPGAGIDGFGFNFDIDTELAPGIRASGGLHFNLSCGVSTALTYKYYVIPKGVRATAGCGLTQSAAFDLVAGSESSDGFEKSFVISRMDLEPIVTMIGPVPLVWLPRLTVSVDVKGHISAGVSFGAEEHIKARIGIEYNKGVHPFKEFEKGASTHSSGFESGSVDVAAGPVVGVEVMLYGIVGPSVRLAGLVDFSAGFGRSPAWCLDLLLQAGVGIHVDFGIASVHWGPANILDEKFRLACAENLPPVVTILSPADGANLYTSGGFGQTFTATARDPESNTLVPVTWSSDRDGALAMKDGHLTFRTEGLHTLTASATDAQGAVGSRSIQVTVSKPKPVLTVALFNNVGRQDATNGETVTKPQGAIEFLRVTPKIPGAIVPDSCRTVTWSGGGLSLTPTVAGGCEARLVLDRPGTFEVSASYTSPEGLVARGAVTVIVTPSTRATPDPQVQLEVYVRGTRLVQNQQVPAGSKLVVIARYLNGEQAQRPLRMVWRLRSNGRVQDLKTGDYTTSVDVLEWEFPTDCRTYAEVTFEVWGQAQNGTWWAHSTFTVRRIVNPC